MEPIVYIRKTVFGVTQSSFAKIAGTAQATVSRWESGEQTPDRDHMERIRQEASSRGITWDDRWFFEAPAGAVQTAEVAA